MTDEDPFACFDDDNDDDDDSNNKYNEKDDEQGDHYAPLGKRNNDCGVMAFHSGTEHSLLVHVQNEIGRDTSHPTSSAMVLDAIDTFCMDRHWMMHVGPQKGQVLETFLIDCLTVRKNQDYFGIK